MQYKNLITLALVSAFAAGISHAEQQTAICDVAAVMAEARIAQQKAQSVGGEWRDLAKTLDQAAVAAAEGDCEKANKKYAAARFQGEMGYQQALEQANAGNPAYLNPVPRKTPVRP
ncbi:MAG: SoxXA-binding protein [Gammaproteobacteria bacterium]|nr:SoxXA-binding protein [Gammaproteobacteria bacterium]MBU1655561.1 SoxXA-binding protein [Gammaproteobacteria bacterium]MBU1960258.1 SoxXA-binding protein [Gammaproteobacteria bacterium]